MLPCYNPCIGWYSTLAARMDELNRSLPGYAIRYIISNDGSTRLDRAEVQRLLALPGVLFLDNPVNEGKGAAIRKGTLQADGEIVIYTDIDFPFGIGPVVEMVRLFSAYPECYFIYGKRNDAYFRMLPVRRRIISRGVHFFNRIFLSNQIVDTQAGIKGLRKEIVPFVQLTKTNTFVFEIELMRKLLRNRIGIRPVEVAASSTLVFTDFSTRTLLRELKNLTRIVLKRGL